MHNCFLHVDREYRDADENKDENEEAGRRKICIGNSRSPPSSTTRNEAQIDFFSQRHSSVNGRLPPSNTPAAEREYPPMHVGDDRLDSNTQKKAQILFPPASSADDICINSAKDDRAGGGGDNAEDERSSKISASGGGGGSGGSGGRAPCGPGGHLTVTQRGTMFEEPNQRLREDDQPVCFAHAGGGGSDGLGRRQGGEGWPSCSVHAGGGEDGPGRPFGVEHRSPCFAHAGNGDSGPDQRLRGEEQPPCCVHAGDVGDGGSSTGNPRGPCVGLDGATGVGEEVRVPKGACEPQETVFIFGTRPYMCLSSQLIFF